MRRAARAPGRIVITGGAGFIGSHLADRLLRSLPRCRVTLADRMRTPRAWENVRPALATGRAEVAQVDVLDEDELPRVVRDADVVVHAAAETSIARAVSDPEACARTNAHGTRCVLEACRRDRIGRVLFFSTQMVYGAAPKLLSEDDPLRPNNPYAASKAEAEAVVRRYRSIHGMDVRVLRPSNVIGTRQPPEKVLPTFIGQMLRGEALTVYDDGSILRSYVVAEDFCAAAERVILHASPSVTLNVGSDEEHTNLAIARMVCRAFGRRPEEWIRYVPGQPCADCHYRLDTRGMLCLGWRARKSVAGELPRIVDWYRAARAGADAAPTRAARAATGVEPLAPATTP